MSALDDRCWHWFAPEPPFHVTLNDGVSAVEIEPFIFNNPGDRLLKVQGVVPEEELETPFAISQ